MRRVWLWHAVSSYTLNVYVLLRAIYITSNARTHIAHISRRDRLGSSSARGPRTARISPAPPSPPSEVGRHVEKEKVQHDDFSHLRIKLKPPQSSFSSEICSTRVSTQRRQQLCSLAVAAAAVAAVLACSCGGGGGSGSGSFARGLPLQRQRRWQLR